MKNKSKAILYIILIMVALILFILALVVRSEISTDEYSKVNSWCKISSKIRKTTKSALLDEKITLSEYIRIEELAKEQIKKDLMEQK